MKNIILFLLLSLPFLAISQNLNDFKYFNREYGGNTFIGFSPVFSMVRNSEAPNSTIHSLNGFSGKLDMRKIDFSPGGKRWIYQHKLLFDALLIVENMVNDDGSAYYRSESSSLTTGIIGWVNMGWNVIANDRFCFALGGNLNDYFLGSSYQVDSLQNDLVSFEPQGYWFAGGPSIFADFAINPNLLLQAQASYSFGFWRAVSLDYADVRVDDSYPNPHFGGINIELQTRWGVYVGIDHNWLINRGEIPNNTKRTDLVLGFRFPI